MLASPISRIQTGLIQAMADRSSSAATSPEVYFVSVSPRQVSHIKLFGETALPIVGDQAVTGRLGGEWDRLKMPFNLHYIFRSIKARVQGAEWESTSLNKRRSRERSREAILKENERIDALIESLGKNGYVSQYELGAGATQSLGGLQLPAEMIVGMDRSGRLFQLSGGRHRLAIAHLLDLPEIPAILSVFHPRGADKLPEKRRMLTGDFEDFRPLK